MFADNRNQAIDGLRGIVALIIALFHFETYAPLFQEPIFETGYLGVEFFFVLSGFLLIKGYEAKDFSVKQKFKKKVLHLYPSYLISILALIMLYACLWFQGDVYAWANSNFEHVTGLITELLAVQALGIMGFHYINYPAYYVSALLISSLIILILIKVLKRKYCYFSLACSISLYLWLFLYNPYMWPESYMQGNIPTTMVRALAGMMLGTFIYHVFLNTKERFAHLSFASATLAEVFLLFFFLSMLLFREASRWNFLIFIPIIGILFLFFSNQGIVSKILSSKPFLFLGRISYPFYLFQSFSSNFVLNVLGSASPLIKTAAYLFLNLAISSLIWLFIERKFVLIFLKQKILHSIVFLGVIFFSFSILYSYGNTPHVDAAPDEIIITAKGEHDEAAEGEEIWLLGVSIDNVFYPAEDLFDTGWLLNNGAIGWKKYDRPIGMENIPQQIRGHIPSGNSRELIFEANRWRGLAQIEFLGESSEVNCFLSQDHGELSVGLKANLALPDTEVRQITVLKFILIVVLLLFIAHVYLHKCPHSMQAMTYAQEKRDPWINVLILFCLFALIMQNATSEGYTANYTEPIRWYGYLYINSFTAFAAPILFMLVGIFLIENHSHFLQNTISRFKKIYLLLIVWSLVYIATRKWVSHEELSFIQQAIKIFSEPQYAHLWFIYTLFGVALLSPILSHIYYHARNGLWFYFICIFGILPILLSTIELVTGFHVNIPFLHVFFPEAFLLVLGKRISESKRSIFKKWYLWAATALGGYCMIVVMTYYHSLAENVPERAYFSNYGTLPSFIYYVSIFCLFYSLKKSIQQIPQSCYRKIWAASEVWATAYCIHMLIYLLLDKVPLWRLPAFSHTSLSLGVSVITAICCFSLSVLAALVIRKLKVKILPLCIKLLS